MKTVKYTTTILSDGHLFIPEDVKKELELDNNSIVKVVIAKEEGIKAKSTEEFLKLFGTWEDERDADEIIKEIYETRIPSKRESEL